MAISQNDVNSIIKRTPFYDPERCSTTTTTGSLSGSNNKEKIFNYLVGKQVNGMPLKDFHVAGIMGNMQSESGFEPQRAQGIFDRLVPADQWFVAKGGGYGLVQWTPGSKMVDPVTAAGKDANDIGAQLDFLIEQLNGQTPSPEGPAGVRLVTSTTLASATIAFEVGYERHAGPPQPERVVQAENILREMQALGGSTTATGTTTPDSTSDSGSGGGLGAAVGNQSNKPKVVLDPGHDGTDTDRTDPATGLHDGTLTNPTERRQVWEVAQNVKTKLENVGYEVHMTKNSQDDTVFLRDRANVANNIDADIAVSIHTDGAHRFGEWQEIYVQKNGLYRGGPSNRVTFNNSEVATKSQEYAEKMKQKRDEIEATSGETVIKDNSFDGRGGGIEPGNIPLVQLFSERPWIYLEAGGNNTSTGMTEEQKGKYADAIFEGIKAAVPAVPQSGVGCGSGSTEGSGDVVATALEFAWPAYRDPDNNAELAREMKPEYANAVREAQSQSMYVGGTTYPGVDCGGFVTRVMLNSGYEPNYNYGGKLSDGGPTSTQHAWLRENWEELGSGSDSLQVQPGDVAIKSGGGIGHTYVYVGQQANFEKPIASASLNKRAPMAGNETTTDPEYTWYRKK